MVLVEENEDLSTEDVVRKRDPDVLDGGTSDVNDCLQRYHPKHNTEDFLALVAVLFISLGLAFVCSGYIVPRDYQFDPSLPARQMEEIEMHYAKLSYHLDVLIVVGMACVATGGIIISGISVYSIVAVKPRLYRQQDRRDIRLLNTSHDPLTSYGSQENR